MLRISSELREAMLAEAAAHPDVEVCGLLFGDQQRVIAAQPTANVSPCPHDSFEIDPAALFAAHKAVRAGGPAVIGCYHSHPNGKAEPSARDAAMAEEGAVWVIIAGGAFKAWAYESGRFRPVQLSTP